MPATIAVLTPHGLTEAPYHADSMDEAARLEADGIYDVTRTYPGGRVFRLDAHFDRLERSARLENIPLSLDRARIHAAVRQLLEQSEYGLARLRFAIDRAQPRDLTLTLTPYAEFGAKVQRLRQHGLKVATYHITRQNPRAKTNLWVHQREAARATLPADTDECIINNEEGELLEGFSSNFYAIMDGQLYTAGQGVLPGIARTVLLEVAPELLPVNLRPVKLVELPLLQEAMLTSSGRGLLPIVRINEQVLGNGAPGPQTQRLMAQYDAWVDAHLEPL